MSASQDREKVPFEVVEEPLNLLLAMGRHGLHYAIADHISGVAPFPLVE
jgi:hypothetical protein